MEIWVIFLIVIIALILEFSDAYIGMGFGIITPILFLLGIPLLQAIPAVILTSAILNMSASYFHQNFKNIDFFRKRNLSILKILLFFGIIAVLVGVLVAINIPEKILQLYIGALIIAMGILIFVSKRKKKLNKTKLWLFSSLASFNKGISGGGYGPVLTTGQIYSGIKPKKAVGMTSITEGVISSIGFILYLILNGPSQINFSLIGYLLLGGILATPFAAMRMKQTKVKKLKKTMAIISVILGLSIIVQAFVPQVAI